MEFNYSTMFPLEEDNTEYKKISDSFVSEKMFNDQKWNKFFCKKRINLI